MEQGNEKNNWIFALIGSFPCVFDIAPLLVTTSFFSASLILSFNPFFFSVGQSTSQLTKDLSVNDLEWSVRRKICQKLDLKDTLGKDYRELPARFNIPNEDIRTISQNSDPTDKVLQRLGYDPKITIAKLREVLVTMGRDDCVEIIDQSPQSGMYRYFI